MAAYSVMKNNANNSADLILEARGISKKFGQQRLFRDISIRIEAGQSLALTGPNGSGKSTLLRVLAGLQRPDAGEVAIHGKKTESAHGLGDIGLMGPLVVPYRELTARENILFAARDDRDRDALLAMLEDFGLGPHADKQVGSYSTGMLQRLKFCLALAGDPALLFLDEPGSNLDEPGKEKLYGAIGSMSGKIIVIATNDRNESALCERELRLGQ